MGNTAAVLLSTADLPVALCQPGAVPVVSDAGLAAQVNKSLAEAGQALVVSPVPELEGLGGYRTGIRPADLLHGMGRTTSALPDLAVADAGGLSALTALRTTSQWAVVRYLWAFAPARPDLRLSALTKQVRRHQRALFSEHLGIAFATDLVEQFIAPGEIQVVDADAVDFDPVLRRATAQLGSHRPDYFWYEMSGDAVQKVVVVEVKANSTGRTELIKQLARGAEQVAVPLRLRGVPTRRIVVGTVTSGFTIRTFAVEVGAVDRENRQAAVVDLAAHERRYSGSAGEDSGELIDELIGAVQEAPEEIDQAEALDSIRAGDDARLLTFAGLPQDARSVRQPEVADPALLDGLTLLELEGERYRGRSVPVTTGPGALTVHTGAAEDVLRSSAERSPASYRGPARQPRLSRARGERPLRGRLPDRPGVAVAAVVAADGTALAFSGPPEVIDFITR